MDFRDDKPAGYWRLLSHSIGLYNACVKTELVLALFLALIVFTPQLLALHYGVTPPEPGTLFTSGDLIAMFVYIAALIVFVAMLWRMSCRIKHKKDNIVEDLNIGIHRVWYVFAAAIIQTVLLFLILATVMGVQVIFEHFGYLNIKNTWATFFYSLIIMTQTVLFLYVYALFIFYLPIIAVEGKGILTGIRKSFALVWGNWWKVVSVQATPWLVYFLFLFVLNHFLGLNLNIFLLTPSNQTYLMAILHLLFFAIFTPWVAATLLVQLKDLELRYSLSHGKF